VGAVYTIKYYNPGGIFLRDLEFSTLDLALQENQIGSLTLRLPPAVYPPGFFRRDGTIEVWRAVGGRSELVGNALWFVVYIRYQIDQGGVETLEIVAQDGNSILKRRIIAYAAGTDYALKAGVAGDIMKSLIRENYGTLAIEAERDASLWITVDPDNGDGEAVFGDLAWRNIWDAVAQLASNSEQEGIRVVFDMERGSTPGHLIFKTYPYYRGTDHTSGSPNPVYVGYDYGNLSQPELLFDYSEEINTAYVGGAGSGDVRIIETVTDTIRATASPYARCETFVDGGDSSDSVALQNLGDTIIFKGRPRLILSGNMLDTKTYMYGINYRYGDLVTAQYKGYAVNCRLDTLVIGFDQDNGEQITLRLYGEKVL
jgi:hypothetical protein